MAATGLAKYGPYGILLGLIIFQGFALKVIVSFISKQTDKFRVTLENHFQHVEQAMDRNTQMFGQTSEVMKQNIKSNERVCQKLDKS